MVSKILTNRGACIGHVSPEAAAGGPIALVQDGDVIEIDIPDGTLGLRVEESELVRRRAAWAGPPERRLTGWLRRYAKMAISASQGAVLEG